MIDEWRRVWPVAATVVVVSLAIGLTVHKVDLLLLAFLLQALALWRLWLPIRYQIDEQGIEQGFLGRTLHTPWSAIRRYEDRRDGAQLFRDAEPRPLDSWRGLYLPWSGRRTAVLDRLQAHTARLRE